MLLWRPTEMLQCCRAEPISIQRRSDLIMGKQKILCGEWQAVFEPGEVEDGLRAVLTDAPLDNEER